MAYSILYITGSTPPWTRTYGVASTCILGLQLQPLRSRSVSSQQMCFYKNRNNSSSSSTIVMDWSPGSHKKPTACSLPSNAETLLTEVVEFGKPSALPLLHFWSALLAIWNVGPVFAEDDITQQVEPMSVPPDTAESQFISILLFGAFIGLSLFTVGVTYLGVTEFLEKRERDKLLKEEEAKNKKGKKSKGIKLAKSGPRGFGQRIQEEEDD